MNGQDYHLATGDVAFMNTGVNPALFGYSGPYGDVDIDGEARPSNGAWDIGADEYTP